MKEMRFFYVPDAALQTELPKDEAMHALRVLRLRSGDEIYLMDGDGTFFRAEIVAYPRSLPEGRGERRVERGEGREVSYCIKQTLPQQKAWRSHIHLAISPTKMADRIEWMAEKATELGFDELTFLDCKYSERRALRLDRIERIVVSAMKQSRKAWKPRVNPMISFDDFVHKPVKGRKFIAHCYEEIERKDLFEELMSQSAKSGEEVVVMIGPEGDFSLDEVKEAMSQGFVSVTLGKSRLRTETAGLAAVMMAGLSLR
ncbi:MAG: 16S rRNA (uracil(1498)-N(3))-methyltransferase [Prevotella sp.]|nr:16S rRNA (uracil(1498)-N(3))-methyltransferase [Prevotella sp.]